KKSGSRNSLELRACSLELKTLLEPKSKGEGWGRVGVSAVTGAREGWSVERGCAWMALGIVRVGRSSPLFFGSAHHVLHTEEIDRKRPHRPGAGSPPVQ